MPHLLPYHLSLDRSYRLMWRMMTPEYISSWEGIQTSTLLREQMKSKETEQVESHLPVVCFSEGVRHQHVPSCRDSQAAWVRSCSGWEAAGRLAGSETSVCLVRNTCLTWQVGPKLQVGTEMKDAVSSHLSPGHLRARCSRLLLDFPLWL